MAQIRRNQLQVSLSRLAEEVSKSAKQLSLWVLGGPKAPERMSQEEEKWDLTNLSSYFQPISPSGPKGLWVHNQEKIARWYVDSNLTRDQTSVEPSRDLFAHALLNEKLYIMGGEKLSITGGERRSRKVMKECLIFDHKGRTWSQAPDLLRETSGRNAVVLQGKIYLTTGRNGEALGKLDVFDPKMDEWTETEGEMTTARYGHATATSQNHLLWIFGGQNESGQVLADVERYDINTSQWETMNPLGIPRTYLSVSLFQEEFYAIGGKKNKSGIYHSTAGSFDGHSGLEICGDVEIFDLNLAEWRTGPSLNFPRAGHGSVVLSLPKDEEQHKETNRRTLPPSEPS